MSDKDVNEARCTPTDPSLEFDLCEVVRLRLAGALTRRDYDPLEAEGVALYDVKGVPPVSQFLRVLTTEKAPGDGEIMDVLTRTLDEAPTVARATRLPLRAEVDKVNQA